MRNRILIPRILLSLAIGQFLLTEDCVTQQAQWVQATPITSPPVREGAAMAYDWVRGRTVLFGGWPLLNDTWEWDGKNWTQMNPKTIPPARAYHSLVYDLARKRVVLFGGMAKWGLHNDTWEGDGKDWNRVYPPLSPIPQSGHGMAYDISRGRSVLVGFGLTNDTWEWDGKNWTQLKPSPVPKMRIWFAMAYDSARRQIVIFGGRDIRRLGWLNDTWTWDGKVWKPAVNSSAPPSQRQSHAMAYDILRQRAVLFGGQDRSKNVLSDTYEWDGTNWTRANPLISPPKRRAHAMAYDVARRQVVLFGGFNKNFQMNDTWLYGLKKTPGKYTSYGTGCGTPAVTLSAAPASTPTIGQNFLLDSRKLPQASTMALMAFGASRTKFGSITLPLNLSPFGMPGCFLHQSTELLVTYPVKNGSGQFALPIPFDAQLIAATVFAQAIIVAPNANSAGLLSSNGGAILIGN